MRRQARDVTAIQPLHRQAYVARRDAPERKDEQHWVASLEDTSQTEEARQAEQDMPWVQEGKVQEEEQQRVRRRWTPGSAVVRPSDSTWALLPTTPTSPSLTPEMPATAKVYPCAQCKKEYAHTDMIKSLRPQHAVMNKDPNVAPRRKL